MSQVRVTETSLETIADAIRAKLGVQTTYKPGEMAAAIASIPGYPEPSGTIQITQNGTVNVKDYASAEVDVQGSGAVVQPLSVTQNGTYTPPSGVDGYAPVTVNVSGGGGGNALVNFDFTKGDFTQNNVTYDQTGAHFSTTNGYLKVPFARSGMAIEVDVASMQLSSGTHRRFLMATTSAGLIYRSSGVWAFYSNAWEESQITDGSFFDNSTVRVEIDSTNHWHIYKDGIVVFEPTLTLASANDTFFWIGSDGQSINNAIITAARIW